MSFGMALWGKSLLTGQIVEKIEQEWLKMYHWLLNLIKSKPNRNKSNWNYDNRTESNLFQFDLVSHIYQTQNWKTKPKFTNRTEPTERPLLITHHTPNHTHKGSITPLCNTMLRSSCHSILCTYALFFKKFCKWTWTLSWFIILSIIFTTSIWPNDFHFPIQLSFNLINVHFESVHYLRFFFQQIDKSKMWKIIDKGDNIFFSTKRWNIK